MSDVLPIGAVVTYEFEGRRCPMVVVAHAPKSERDPETLYFLVEYRGDLIYVEWPDLPMYSTEYLIYNLLAGWSKGNVDRHLLTDTGGRVEVVSYAESKKSDPRRR